MVFDRADAAIRKIPVEVIIPTDNTNTTETYGSYAGTYQIVNAYKFLKCYLKYYEYNISTRYDVAAGKIVFAFVKCNDAVAINLSDFIHELTTTSTTTNKAVATIKYNVETQKTDDDGNPVYNDDGSPAYIPKYKPRPPTLATVYYYRDKDNNIVQSDAAGNIAGRLYPVKAKIFESEYLADAQFSAVNELANARYVDNIIIEFIRVGGKIAFYRPKQRARLLYGLRRRTRRNNRRRQQNSNRHGCVCGMRAHVGGYGGGNRTTANL